MPTMIQMNSGAPDDRSEDADRDRSAGRSEANRQICDRQQDGADRRGRRERLARDGPG